MSLFGKKPANDENNDPGLPLGPLTLSDGSVAEPINDDEVKFLRACHHYASTIFSYLKEKPNKQGVYEPKQIDRAIKTEQADPELTQKLSMNEQYFRFALGGSWGEYLIATYGMDWRVINDQYGSEMCIFTTKNEIKVFPFQAVNKCMDEGATSGIWERTKSVANLLADQRPN
jgi:hypothetical protein